MRWFLALGLVLATSTAHARTATGYREGEKVEIRIADCGGAEAEVHTAIAFRAMARAASKAGIDLRVRSGFRSYAKQKKLYRKYRQGEGNLAARPGYSNHESGRALDLYITDYKVYEWLQDHAARYGFHRTVPGEPWHWEYLGGYEPERRASARRAPRS
ncbi:MAG: D-alanyl-D-alanine carboxypeptidase family protein [Acidobacteriota bacterium]